MTAVPARAQTPLQPRPKAPATSTTFPLAAVASSKVPSPRPSPPLRAPSKAQNAGNATSDRVTQALIRRTLCPLSSSHSEKGHTTTPASIDTLLPPLTSSNEVDLQLYAFIAIIIKDFVYTWYAKITQDQVFVEEVIKIIAHVTRGLEGRLRKVDLESLVFDEIMELLEAHVIAYRTAHTPLHPDPLEYDPRSIYHSLCPLLALSPVPDPKNPASIREQQANEAAYRQLLVEGCLTVLLPTDDLENSCLTALVGQILSEMVIGNAVGGTASEPWVLWEGIMKAGELLKEELLSVSNTEQRVDTAKSSIPETDQQSSQVGTSLQKTFWTVLQFMFLAFTAIRFIIIAIATSASLPSRITSNAAGSSEKLKPSQMEASHENIMPSKTSLSPMKQPIISMRVWSCISRLLDLDMRMPWVSASIKMMQWRALYGPGRVGDTDGMLDRFLSHTIHNTLFDPSSLPSMLRSLRAIIFPNNTLAPARVRPSPEESLVIRKRCAETILDIIPPAVQNIYFGTADGPARRVQEVEDILDTFSDAYCNRHLMYGIVELIVLRLVPELEHRAVSELWGERLS